MIFHGGKYAAVIVGDNLKILEGMADASVHCCITSPPYFGLRDYGHDGQIGLEDKPEVYIAKLVQVFREVRRVLRDDGTLWVNIGDSYASTGGHGGIGATSQRTGRSNVDAQNARKGYAGGDGIKQKDLLGIPWMLAFALRADGWYLRQDIIWHKSNPMPESVTDRCTKAHEYVFLLSKSPQYFFDFEAVKEPAVSKKPAGNKNHKGATAYDNGDKKHRTKTGLKALAGVEWQTRNRRSVWTVATRPYRGSHFAVFPPNLIEPCVLAGCPEGGTVLDIFSGSGTTGGVALALSRNAILLELNPEYADLTPTRVASIIASSC